MDINFHLSEDVVNQLTWEEYEAFERAQDGESIKLYQLRPVLARFVVDENKKPIPHEKAMKQLGKVSMPQIKDVVTAFMSSLSNSAIPKGIGNSSNSPLEAEPQVSEFPAGSE